MKSPRPSALIDPEVHASGEHLRILAELAPVAVFICREAGFPWVNRAAEELTGFSASELGSMSFPDLMVAEEAEMGARNADANLRGETATSRFEFRLRRKDGEHRWIDFSAARISYQGEAALLGTAVDMSAHKQAEETMRKSEEIFRYVVESAIDLITIISDDGIVKFTGPAVQRVLGYAPEELVGKNALSFIHPDDMPIALEGIRLGIEDYRNNPPIEVRARHVDGSYRPFEVASSHYFEGTERKGLACSFRPISGRDQAETDLRESERKYRVLFTRNLAGVYVSRLDGRMLDCNAAVAKVFGYASRLDMIHLNATQFYFCAEDRMRFVDVLRRDGSVSDFVSRCRRADGSEVWILENAVLFEPAPGAELLVQGTLLDITGRKRGEDLQSALYRIASLTNSPLEPQAYYHSLRQILSELMYAENFYISVLKDDQTTARKRLQFKYFVDQQEPQPKEREVAKGFTEYVIRTAKPLLADLRISSELEAAGEIDLLGAPSIDWMGAPLFQGSEAIGVIALQSYSEGHRYTASDLEVLTLLAHHIAAAIARESSQQALRESELSHRSLIQSAVYGIYRSSFSDDRFLEVNPALVRMLGYGSAEELLGISLSRQLYQEEDGSRLLLERYQQKQHIENIETRWLRKDGHAITVRLSGRVLYKSPNAPSGFEMIVEDVTERHALETHLRHSQKMEAVGRLAGGIAHDFNNLLTVIKGYSEIALGHPQVHDNVEIRTQIEEIGRAATRAGGLARQLLAFSRQQVITPAALDLNSILRGMEGLLNRIAGGDIRIVLLLASGLGRIKADPAQIEQVIMNLAVNARDAIGGSGDITIETANVRGDEPAFAGHWSGSASDSNCGSRDQNFVMLYVRDTGAGMSQEVRGRIFEPFFTTKEIGKGTGLGLSTVYGIVQQSNGFVSVENAPGQGSGFRIFLPQVNEAAKTDIGPSESSGIIPVIDIRSRGTVLLVEDEESVRSLMREVLERRGFHILEARHAGEAIIICERHPGEINLLLTDLSLEYMNGIELAERLKLLRLGMSVLFVSGYTPDGLAGSGLLNHKNFLAKPFSAEELLSKIEEILERESRKNAAAN